MQNLLKDISEQLENFNNVHSTHVKTAEAQCKVVQEVCNEASTSPTDN
jgi:hypothetical protein